MLRLLERGFVETHEVRRIATHEEEGWRPPVVLPARKAGEEEIRQRLENLGYLSGKQGWER